MREGDAQNGWRAIRVNGNHLAVLSNECEQSGASAGCGLFQGSPEVKRIPSGHLSALNPSDLLGSRSQDVVRARTPRAKAQHPM